MTAHSVGASGTRPILITGGAGFVGAHFVDQLERAGREYVVLDSLERGKASFVPAERLIIGDIADAELVTDICRDYRPEIAVHFAAYAYVAESVAEPALYYRNNVTKTQTAFDTMRLNGVRNVVFSSSCATYGVPTRSPITESTPQYPINPYGETKLIAERMLSSYREAYGLNYVCLRYFNAAGCGESSAIYEQHDPETHLIPLAIRAGIDGAPLHVFGTDYATADGSCVRDYVHVEDLASAHLAALDALDSGRTLPNLNLGSGSGISVLEVAGAVEALLGCKLPIYRDSKRSGDPPVLVAAVELAQRALNWRATRSDLATILQSALAGELRRRAALGSAGTVRN